MIHRKYESDADIYCNRSSCQRYYPVILDYTGNISTDQLAPSIHPTHHLMALQHLKYLSRMIFHDVSVLSVVVQWYVVNLYDFDDC